MTPGSSLPREVNPTAEFTFYRTRRLFNMNLKRNIFERVMRYKTKTKIVLLKKKNCF